jgi:branched-chain amino acid transport system permease protein
MKTWRNHLGLLVPLLVVAGMVLWPVVTGNVSNRESSFTILKAIALASSLNILLGYTGYVSFGHIVFYGFGGYVGLYFVNEQGWSIWAGILVGGIASGVLAFLLGKAILRLRGAYFALATIGINEAMRAFINNIDLFGGPIGMTINFSVYREYGGAADALRMSFFIMAGLTLAALVLSHLVRTSKFGLGLQAIRENEDAAEVMGVVAPDAKTWAYVLSAIIPGMVGVLFFFKNGNVAASYRLPAALFHRITRHGDARRPGDGSRADHRRFRLPGDARLPGHKPDLQRYPTFRLWGVVIAHRAVHPRWCDWLAASPHPAA